MSLDVTARKQIELAILRACVARFKEVKVADKNADKFDTSVDLRTVIRSVWQGSITDAELDYEATSWVRSLIVPRVGSLLRPGRDAYSARAYEDPIRTPPNPAWVRLAELETEVERSAEAASMQAIRDSVVRDAPKNHGPTFGILTALPKEFAAVRLMLDTAEEWTAPGDGAGRRFLIGTINTRSGHAHSLAVALLPDMGNNSASASATLLLTHFPNVRHIVMCGIAGGVPRPGVSEDDVRLGDIIVSNKQGVIQYDLVKEGADGLIEHRHPPRAPSAELLEAVRHLETEELLQTYPWESHLSRGARMKHGTRPQDELDAQGSKVDYPADTERRPGLPRVFVGPIAAANVLLKNPQKREYLRDHFKVKAIEMEGSGVADATWVSGRAGFLVIRGVCDYCDEKKGDLWQGAAAVAAAAYLRALVESIPVDGMPSIPKGTNDSVVSTRDVPPVVLSEEDMAYDERAVNTLSEWISGVPYDRSGKAIPYQLVDGKLSFRPGTTKRLLSQAVGDRPRPEGGWYVHRAESETFSLNWHSAHQR